MQPDQVVDLPVAVLLHDVDAVVGGDESSEFIRQSQTIAEAWNQDEVVCRCEVVPGKNHFTVIEAMADPDSAMVARLVTLASPTF